MEADLIAVLAEDGGAAVDIVLDGTALRAFVEDIAFHDCPYDGVVLERKQIILLDGVVLDVVPLQEMILGSTRFIVESAIESFPAFEMILTRFGS